MKSLFFLKALLLCLVTLILSSCNPHTESEFADEYILTADSIRTGSIFDSVFMTTFDDYLVFSSYNADTLLHFYQLPDARYSFGAVKKGDGPDEIKSMVTFCKGNPDYLYVKGFSDESIRKMKVSKNQIITEQEYQIKIDGAPNHMHIICDSLLFFNDIPRKQLKSYNLSSGIVEKSVSYDTRDEKMSSSVDIDRGCFSANTQTALMAYQYRKEIDIFRTYDLKKIGTIKWNYNNQEDMMAGSPDDIVLYYTGIQSTGTSFYLLCQNALPMDDNQPSSVEVYDTKGQPKSRFTLDRRIYMFCVDEKHGHIYGKGENDDYIYRYAF